MRVGDTIRFITSNNRVPNFNNHGKGIINGRLPFKENKGIIISVEEEECLISYTSDEKKEVRLRFKYEVFEIINNTYDIY